MRVGSNKAFRLTGEVFAGPRALEIAPLFPESLSSGKPPFPTHPPDPPDPRALVPPCHVGISSFSVSPAKDFGGRFHRKLFMTCHP